MFRYLVVLAFLSLPTLPGVAQAVGDATTDRSLDSVAPRLQSQSRPRSGGVPDARISIARLRVPRKARQLYEKALAAWLRHANSQSQHDLDQALKIEPEFPEALTLQAFLQTSRQQWASAEENLQAAIQIDPGYAPAYVILAGVYNTQSRFDDAQQAAQQAVSIGATAWSVQYEIARSLIGKEQFESALAVTEAALRSDHGPLIHLAKAHALLGLLQYRPAADELREFLHDQPSGDGSDDARALLRRVAEITHEPPNGE